MRGAGLAVSLLCGALFALCFLGGWLLVGRPLSSRSVTVTLYIAASATLSSGAALHLMGRFRRRPWTARFAAALFVLLAGPAVLSSFFMAVQEGLHSPTLTEVPLRLAFLLAGLLGAGAIYTFLAVAGPLMLPLGLPLALLLAAVMSRSGR